MKKWIVPVLAGCLILGGCRAKPVEGRVGGAEAPGAQKEGTASVSYEVNPSLPPYIVTITYSAADRRAAETMTVTEKTSGKEIQRIALTENLCDTELPVYAADITFDGYADLLIPCQRTAGAAYFQAYVWDAETGGLVYAPGFQELSNPAPDAAQKRVLSHRAADKITSYGISAFDPGKGDFVMQNSLYWETDGGQVSHLKEERRKDGAWETVADFTFSGEGMALDSEDSRIKPYLSDGSLWELGSDKWERFAVSPDEFRPTA